MSQVPRTYWVFFAVSLAMVLLALSLVLFSPKSETPEDLYPGDLRGPAQLVPLGKSLLLSELTIERDGQGRELFCSLLSPQARQQIDLNPHLSCSQPISEDDHGHDEEFVPSPDGKLRAHYDAPAERLEVFIRPFDVRDGRARLAAISCAQNTHPETGKKGVFVSRPRFARAQLFPPGTPLRPSRTKDLQVTIPGGTWLITDFFEEIFRKPTREEMFVAWSLYRQMKAEAPWCPLPKVLRQS